MLLIVQVYSCFNLSNVVSAHGHGLLVVHFLEVVEEAAANLLDTFVNAILAKVASVKVGDLPAHVVRVLELLHGVEAHGVDEASRGLETARVLIIYRMIHTREAPDSVINVAENLPTASIMPIQTCVFRNLN